MNWPIWKQWGPGRLGREHDCLQRRKRAGGFFSFPAQTIPLFPQSLSNERRVGQDDRFEQIGQSG